MLKFPNSVKVWAIVSIVLAPKENFLVTILREKDYNWLAVCFDWPSGAFLWSVSSGKVAGFTTDSKGVYLDDKLFDLRTGKQLDYAGYQYSFISPEGSYLFR